MSAVTPTFVILVLMGKMLFPVLNIYPGGRQEALGFAFQQTALTMIERPETFSEEEKKVFFTILELTPETLEEVYDPQITDPIKATYRFDTEDALVVEYLRQWFLHFFRTPMPYIRATLSVSGGYIAPVNAIKVYSDTCYSEVINAFGQRASHEAARDTVVVLFEWLEHIPGLNLLFQNALYMFWFPVFSFYVFCRTRQREYMMTLVPFAANFLFLLIGPVCWTRYGLCQLYTFPVLLALTAKAYDISGKA